MARPADSTRTGERRVASVAEPGDSCGDYRAYLVFPDAPLPEPPAVLVAEELPPPAQTRDAQVRPEPGRRWMHYAEEDGELAEERRARWDQIVARSDRPSFKETSEPPLAIQEKKSP